MTISVGAPTKPEFTAASPITSAPTMLEALVIHIIYEIMREAGLRAPKRLSHAVSIVGALVTGEDAVN